MRTGHPRVSPRRAGVGPAPPTPPQPPPHPRHIATVASGAPHARHRRAPHACRDPAGSPRGYVVKKIIKKKTKRGPPVAVAAPHRPHGPVAGGGGRPAPLLPQRPRSREISPPHARRRRPQVSREFGSCPGSRCRPAGPEGRGGGGGCGVRGCCGAEQQKVPRNTKKC